MYLWLLGLLAAHANPDPAPAAPPANPAANTAPPVAPPAPPQAPPPAPPPTPPQTQPPAPPARPEDEEDDLKGAPPSIRKELQAARAARRAAEAKAEQERQERERVQTESQRKLEQLESEFRRTRVEGAMRDAAPQLAPDLRGFFVDAYDRYAKSVPQGQQPVSVDVWLKSETVTKDPVMSRLLAPANGAPAPQRPPPAQPPNVGAGSGPAGTPPPSTVSDAEAAAASTDPSRWATVRDNVRAGLEAKYGRAIGNPPPKK